MSAMYAVYHGPDGLKDIASRVHTLTLLLAKGIIQHTGCFKSLSYTFFLSGKGLSAGGHQVKEGIIFDTLKVTVAGDKNAVKKRALDRKINLGSYPDGSVCT